MSPVSPPALTVTTVSGTVYRVAYGLDPWAWVAWEFAPFTGRFDDARGQFRVLYASRTRLACYLEVTAQFRPDLTLFAQLDAVAGDSDDDNFPTLAAGHLPGGWLTHRTLGSAAIAGTYVDLAAKESLAWLRPRLASRLVHYNVPDLDGAAIRATVPRALTQELSTLLYATTMADQSQVDGIEFESRHGGGLTVYAIYERPAAGDDDYSRLLASPVTSPIDPHDPDLVEALAIHGLTLA